VIRPALKKGRWVLCDRFTDATEAYQGAGRGVNPVWIRQLARIAHPRLMPDLTFVFDAPHSVAHARIAGRESGCDRIEAEDAAFFERVRQGYFAIAAREPGRVQVIDATAGEREVAAAVVRALDQRIGGS
jgi:dTMP kinase